MADNARNELVESLKSLLDTGKYSDFVITCKGQVHNVHKAVVCARSGFLKDAERFPGRKSKEGKIDLPEGEPEIVKLLIEYLYQGEYDPKLPDGECMVMAAKIELIQAPAYYYEYFTGRREPAYSYEFPHTCASTGCETLNLCDHHLCGVDDECVGIGGPMCKDFVCKICCRIVEPITLPPPEGDAEQLILHAKMYEIGDKYDVVGLKQLAREKFMRASVQYWDSEQFAPAADYAFSTTPEDDKGLRDIIRSILSQNMSLLEKPAVETLLIEFNGLAVDVLKMRAKDTVQI